LHVYGGAEKFSSYSRKKAVVATQLEMYSIISRIFKISIDLKKKKEKKRKRKLPYLVT